MLLQLTMSGEKSGGVQSGVTIQCNWFIHSGDMMYDEFLSGRRYTLRCHSRIFRAQLAKLIANNRVARIAAEDWT